MAKKFTIETFNPATERDVTEPVELDLTKRDDRVRLEKHTLWALNNGHAVSIYPEVS